MKKLFLFGLVGMTMTFGITLLTVHNGWTGRWVTAGILFYIALCSIGTLIQDRLEEMKGER